MKKYLTLAVIAAALATADLGLAMGGGTDIAMQSADIVLVFRSERGLESIVNGKFTLGALISLCVTVADLGILNIGAAFWGLVAGFGVSWLMEKRDFQALANAN